MSTRISTAPNTPKTNTPEKNSTAKEKAKDKEVTNKTYMGTMGKNSNAGNKLKRGSNISNDISKDEDLDISRHLLSSFCCTPGRVEKNDKLRKRNSNKSDLSCLDLSMAERITIEDQTVCPLCKKKCNKKYLEANIIAYRQQNFGQTVGKLAATQNKNKKLATENGDLTKENKKLATKNGNLTNYTNKLSKKVDKVVEHNQELRDDKLIDTLRSKAVMQENARLQNDLDLQKKNNLRLKWVQLALKNQVTQKENEVKSINSKVKELKDQYNQWQNELNVLKEEKNVVTEKVEKLEAENAKQKKLLEDNNNSLASKNKELETLKQNNDELEKQNKELKEKNTSLEMDNDSLNNQIEELKTKLDEQKRNYEKQQIKAAKSFLLVASNTHVEINRVLYFLAWLFQCISSSCGEYIEKVDQIDNLNQKFYNLTNLISQEGQQENDNLIKEVENNNIIENSGNKLSYNGAADAILNVLDDFLPTCEGDTFSKYVYAYYHLLNLCEHDTSKIYEPLRQSNLLNQDKNLCNMLKEKINSLKSSKELNDNNGKDQKRLSTTDSINTDMKTNKDKEY